MNITFKYFAQIRQKAGTESETIEVAEGATVLESLRSLDHSAEFSGLLFDESGALRPVILLLVNDTPSTAEQVLSHGDCVQVFSPVAGG